MRWNLLLPLVLAVALAGCTSMSSRQAGWTGSGATPFDAAYDKCEAESASASSEKAARNTALELSMAKEGGNCL